MKRKKKRGKKAETPVHVTTRVVPDEVNPVIEARLTPFGGGAAAGIPEGKVLVIRTPILPPGATDEEILAATEEVLVDADGADPFHCPDCEAASGNGFEWLEHLEPWPGAPGPGRRS